MEGGPCRAYFRFYAELNDHLPPEQRHNTLERQFWTAAGAKDMIESFGVPHSEVELILVNGESVDFSYRVRDGDRISIYPMFESMDIAPELRVRPAPLREPKFVLDVHLGKLAAYLRMLGFDALYRSCFTDRELVQISSDERRTLLTRDRGLLKHGAVTHGYWLRATDSKQQLAEIVKRFDLAGAFRLFARCMACNGALRAASRDEVLHLIPPRIAQSHKEFQRCAACGRAYWKGTHYERMERWITELRDGMEGQVRSGLSGSKWNAP